MGGVSFWSGETAFLIYFINWAGAGLGWAGLAGLEIDLKVTV